MTALWDEHTVSVEDVAAEAARWPWFGPAEASSMHSFQLFARENSLGALNLYTSMTHSFTDHSRTLGELFAMYAATALGQAQHVIKLHQALASRDVICQAKGTFVERFGLDGEQASSCWCSRRSRRT